MSFSIRSALRSSRRRYLDYRGKLKQRRAEASAAGDTSAGHHGDSAGSPAPAESSPPSAHGGKSRRRSRSFSVLFRQFWGLLPEHRRTIYVALVFLSLSTLLVLVPPYGTKIVFDNVLGTKPLKLPAPFDRWLQPHLPTDRGALLGLTAITMVVIGAVSELIGLVSRWQATRITKRVQMGVRRKVFDHAVQLPLHRVYELKSGGVASILREDAGGVGELIFSMLYNPARAIIQLIGSLVILARVDWRLLVGSLILLPTVWLTHKTWIGRIRPLFRDIRSTRQQIDSHATEAFGGMRVVRSFSRQKFETGTFTRDNHLMGRQEIFAWWWMRGIDLAWSLLIPFATALLLYYGGHKVLADQEKVAAGLMRTGDALTGGDLFMFIFYLAALLGPIAVLASSATGLQNSLSGLDRVLDLLAEAPEMPSRPGAAVVSKASVAGRITFESVSFRYPQSEPARSSQGRGQGHGHAGGQGHSGGHGHGGGAGGGNGAHGAGGTNDSGKKLEGAKAGEVLHDISLDVMPGEMVALVGPSGAGKTTLCNLVARFYDPSAGAVLLDGVDLRDITADSYRRLLGIVEQDTFLFDGTIAQNIAYGRRDATADQVRRAAERANAHGFIEALPQGYGSLIGERGVKLSGGQRQRLTIARALLADPKILILDEATSNLDTESERLIQSSLRTLMAGRTSFVIAHRLSTIAHADRIVVVEGGRIVEQGRHEELMAASGRYRAMVDLQTSPPTFEPEAVAETVEA